MLTNHGIWPSRSLWNNFRMIYGEHKLFIRFNVVIETQRLSVFTLNPIRTERLEPMKSLKERGHVLCDIGYDLTHRSPCTSNDKEYCQIDTYSAHSNSGISCGIT
jgi:hypothetical protein